MIPLTISTFDAADISDHDENLIPNDEPASSTRDAVKESIIQVSFAEQTASEMREILSDWNSAGNPEKRQRQPMRRKSFALMEVVQDRPKGRSLSVSSSMKGRTGTQSPTNTLETEMMDYESDVSEGSYLNESLRVDDSFVCDEDDSPKVSFLPSSDVLQQSTEVESIIRKTERQSSEVDRTMHATKYEAVLIELLQGHEILKINDDLRKDKGSQNVIHSQETFLSPTSQTRIIDNPSIQRDGTDKQESRTRQKLFTYVVIPIALSILAAKVLVAHSEVEEEG
ncbi:MAG: hypothetical protein SGBAC_002045 [Bacillariaceae sp.]